MTGDGERGTGTGGPADPRIPPSYAHVANGFYGRLFSGIGHLV